MLQISSFTSNFTLLLTLTNLNNRLLPLYACLQILSFKTDFREHLFFTET
ncbi:hypothetical protein X975_05672, partial [Stegodyphus mimosarum]